MKILNLAALAVTAALVAAGPAFAVTVHLYQYKANAEKHCPSDTVVYVNLTTHIYHYPGTKSYGHLANGKYACLGEVSQDGEFRPAANNQ